MTATTYKFGDDSKTVSFNYGDDGRKADSTLLSGATRRTEYDVLSREMEMTIGGLTRTIAYLNVSGNRTTTLPSSVTYQYGDDSSFVTSYTYDVLGNISTMTVDGVTYTYTYDGLNQLTGIASSDNSYTATYAYDNGGNILSKTVNGITYNYGYDTLWKDLLISYNKIINGVTIEEEISYDAIGNPLNYRGMTMSWTGRQLNSIAIGENICYSYAYNTDGIRIRKTVGNTTTEYFTNGSTILAEKTGDNILWYIYDSDGDLLGFTYNGTPYYYVKNVQGDVYKVVNSNGQVVASYTYDAWGKVLTATGTMADINPIRYRGYYYDSETGLYYLNSRYYDPETGRFINADNLAVLDADTETPIQYNLFAYGFNNPINMSDSSGNWPKWATKVAIGVGIIAAAAAVTVLTGGAAAGPVVAAINCVAHGALVGAVKQGAVGAVTGAVSGAVTHRLTTGSWKGAGKAAVNGAATGFMTGVISGAITGGINSPYCFVAGTTILTAAGAAAIETIQAGDMVWAWNEETGEVALKEVVETYINETDELVHVFVNGEEIVTTPSHPFYSPVKGWTDAAKLHAGDILVLVNGEYVVVEKVQHEILEESVTVYNFQVEDYHTYYVTNNGILVHNTCANERRNAVRRAWKNEVNAVRNETSTYNWTPSQIDELLTKGRVSGYYGHHIKSVKGYPELAGDPNNIRFLTYADHLYQHFGNWRTITHGIRP